MYKRMIALTAALLVMGCAGEPSTPLLPARSLANMPIDPPYDIVFETAHPSDFSDYFAAAHETARQSYLLGAGTEYENEVTVLTGAQPGATIYVVAGVHGDEEAAWRAGGLLKEACIKAGSLYILAPANRMGATAQPPSRYVFGRFDLNRNFPGEEQRNDTQKMANAIFEDIRRAAPGMLLDLHEAQTVSDRYDFLGSALIFTELGDQSDFFLQMILETQQGLLCSRPFDYFSPAPNGSINKAVSQQLLIPTVTVETFRGYEMANRVSDQLSIVGRILTEYGML